MNAANDFVLNPDNDPEATIQVRRALGEIKTPEQRDAAIRALATNLVIQITTAEGLSGGDDDEIMFEACQVCTRSVSEFLNRELKK